MPARVPLRFETLAFPESELLKWRRGNHGMLSRSQASPFIKRILKTKARARPGRRFFGEAFVATRVAHDEGWYGSFKWLTSSAPGANPFAQELRAALEEHLPSASQLPSRASRLRRSLGGKNPVAPDLWLVVNGHHRFIEVKLPGDTVRKTQVAGMALIATCLSKGNDVSMWVYDLHPEGRRPSLSEDAVRAMRRDYVDGWRTLSTFG